jgi:hypothetical protein
MSRMQLLRRVLALVLCLWPAGGVAAEPAPATLEIDYPAEGQAIGGAEGLGLISARIRRGADIDVMLVIDVSDSTIAIAGDVDGDGELSPHPGRKSFKDLFRKPLPAPDSVFAAELLAAEALLTLRPSPCP